VNKETILELSLFRVIKHVLSSLCIPATANMAGSTSVARILGKKTTASSIYDSTHA
jgi:hypothetical protein